MIVLDTNVVSELMRPRPNEGVLNWVDGQVPGTLAVTAITVAEVMYGIGRLPEGGRKDQMRIAASDMFETDLNIILPFDAMAAVDYAALVVDREQAGRPISMADAQIAAICSSNRFTLATRNIRDFEHLALALIDPWEA